MRFFVLAVEVCNFKGKFCDWTGKGFLLKVKVCNWKGEIHVLADEVFCFDR